MTPAGLPLDHRKVLSSAMKRIALALLALMSTTLAACSGGQQSGSSLVGPSGLGVSSAASSAFSGLGETRLPAIVVNDGISCPSDAPLILIGSKDARIDIEWSPIPKVDGYQVSIEAFTVANDWQVVQTLETTRMRAEWSGKEGGIYRVRVRSRVCGGFGGWSAYATQGLTDPQRSAPGKPVEPECPTIGDYRARGYVSTCEPECPTYEAGSYRGRMSAPETTCPPPCQTQTYYPSMTQPQPSPCAPPCEVQIYRATMTQPDPCAPPCDQYSYGGSGWEAKPAPSPCTPPCQPTYYPDRATSKGHVPEPEVPECQPAYYPLP